VLCAIVTAILIKAAENRQVIIFFKCMVPQTQAVKEQGEENKQMSQKRTKTSSSTPR
jgi:hypothetical protein